MKTKLYRCWVSERDIVFLLLRHGGLLLGSRLLVAVVVIVATTIVVAAAVVTVVVALLVTAAIVVAATVVTIVVALLVTTAVVVVTAASLLSTVSAAQELQVLGNNANTAAALAGLLVLPCVHLQAALNEYGAPLAQILGCNLTGAAPACYIQKCCFLAALPVIRAAAHAVYCQAQFGKGVASGGSADLGVCGEVADKHDFVQISHNCLFLFV